MGLIDKYEGFDWDEGNSLKNWEKHGITQEETEQIFYNEPYFDYDDDLHSSKEIRRIVVGRTDNGVGLFVSYTERRRLIRPISSRRMSQKERKWFHEQVEKNTGL
jgi:uncharacterized DUF497 family protein